MKEGIEGAVDQEIGTIPVTVGVMIVIPIEGILIEDGTVPTKKTNTKEAFLKACQRRNTCLVTVRYGLVKNKAITL